MWVVHCVLCGHAAPTDHSTPLVVLIIVLVPPVPEDALPSSAAFFFGLAARLSSFSM